MCQYRTKMLIRCGKACKVLRTRKGNPSRKLPSDSNLPDKLNYFYACFEARNTEACMRAPAVLDDCVITLPLADVSKTLNRSTFTRPWCQMDYQGVYSENSWTNWQVSSLTFYTSP